MNQIAITGGTGFLGSHFLKKNHALFSGVYSIVRAENDSNAFKRQKKSLDSLDRYYKTTAKYPSNIIPKAGDITKFQLGITEQLSIDEFWHFASSLNFEKTKKDKIFKTNLEGVNNVLEFVKKNNIPKFIYISTAYTSGKKSGDIAETFHENIEGCNNAYEESKNKAELFVRDFCEKNKIEYYILRPSIVIGPRETFMTGGSNTGFYGFLRFINGYKNALKNIESDVRILANPDVKLNLVHIDDLMADITLLVKNNFFNQQIHHLSTSNIEFSLNDVHKEIQGFLNIENVILTPPEEYEKLSSIDILIDKQTIFYKSYIYQTKFFQRRHLPERSITIADVKKITRYALEELEDSESKKELFEKQVIKSYDGVALNVYKTNFDREKDLLVFVNAFGMPFRMIDPFLKNFAKQYNIVSWDSRGLPNEGFAIDLNINVGLEAQVSDLDFIIKKYRCDNRKVNIFSWCSGGTVSGVYASKGDSAIDGDLVLINGSFAYIDKQLMTNFEKTLNIYSKKVSQSLENSRVYQEAFFSKKKDLDNEMTEVSDSTIESLDTEFLNYIYEPFSSAEKLYMYCRMIYGIYHNDTIINWVDEIRKKDIKIKIVASSEDQTASYKSSVRLMNLLKGGTAEVDLSTIEGGDHFSLIDPEYISIVKNSVAWKN